jgi:hypothetical protein
MVTMHGWVDDIKMDFNEGVHWIDSEQGPVSDCCEHGNELRIS